LGGVLLVRCADRCCKDSQSAADICTPEDHNGMQWHVKLQLLPSTQGSL
jgi:hypothetical protein